MNQYFSTIVLVVQFLIFGSAIALAPGCVSGSYTVAPGADPLVVHSERALKSAFEVVDSFLKWEHANRAVAGKEAARVAEQLRKDYKEADDAAWSALRAYKTNRTAANKASLNTWLAIVLDLKTSAMSHHGLKDSKSLGFHLDAVPFPPRFSGTLITNNPIHIH